MLNKFASKIKYEWLIALMIFFSSILVVQFDGRPLYMFLELALCLVMFILLKKAFVLPFAELNIYFVALAASALTAVFSDMRYSYQKAAVVMSLYAIPLYFAATYCIHLIKTKKNILSIIIKAIKAMVLAHCIWMPIQLVLYRAFEFDINKFIFVDVFGFLDNASFIRNWSYYPSGLTWHSAVLAPLFVLGLVLFKSIPIRLLILFDTLICGNSTALIGVGFCVALLLLKKLVRREPLIVWTSKTKKQVILLVILATIALVFFGMFNTILDKFIYLFMRLFGPDKDASTEAHLAYYTDYFKVVENSNIFQVIFGYGSGCSGYPYTMLYGRYTSHGNWSVESDVMSILVGRGIVGFVSFYTFLFKIAFKGAKKDFRYLAVMLPIILQGFGYNIQWDYVILIEIIMLGCISADINFFGEVGTESTKLHPPKWSEKYIEKLAALLKKTENAIVSHKIVKNCCKKGEILWEKVLSRFQ